MVSLVENELFLMPSILASACTIVEGETNSPRLKPAIAAAPAAAAPARNFLRFRYKLFGVISDDRMSAGFLISMRCSHLSVREPSLSGSTPGERPLFIGVGLARKVTRLPHKPR